MVQVSKIGAFLMKVLVIIFFIFAFVLFAKVLTSSSRAQAAESLYTPSYCLGAWENPSHASGGRDLEAGASYEDFSHVNAAFLASDSAALIFCGYFSVEPRDGPPNTAHISFSWAANPVHVPPSSFVSTSSPDLISVDNEALPAVIDISEPATDVAPLQIHEATSSEVQNEIEMVDSEVGSKDPDSKNTQTTENPAQEMELDSPIIFPAETPVSTIAPTLNSAAWDFIRYFTPAVSAQESGIEILRVSYSFDGVHWHVSNTATKESLTGFRADIPVSTWQELDNLQIMIIPLSLGERPDVYIDAVELTVDSDVSLAEIVSDGVGTALSFVDKLAQVLTDFSAVPTKEQTVLSSNPNAANFALGSTTHLSQRLVFDLGELVLPVVDDLPWYSDSFKESLPERKFTTPRVVLSEGGSRMTVSGACHREYFVILMYRDTDDYYNNPQNFTSNFAGPCVAGMFTHDMSHVPVDTPDGIYYLLVAEQGAVTPWVPASRLLQVRISHTH